MSPANSRCPGRDTRNRDAPRMGKEGYVMSKTTNTTNNENRMTYYVAAINSDKTTLHYTYIDAISGEAARAEYMAVYGARLAPLDGYSVRVWPYTINKYGRPDARGIMAGARMVARVVSRRALDGARGAARTTDMVAPETWRKDRPSAVALAHGLYISCCAPWADLPYKYDAEDVIDAACVGLMDGIARGESIAEQYKRAYSAANAVLRNERMSIGRRAARTCYIEDLPTGALVSVDGEINRIARGEGRDDDNNTITALATMLETLKPVQRETLTLLARGYSYNQIAERRGCSKQAVSKYVVVARAACVQWLQEHAPHIIPAGVTADDMDAIISAAVRIGAAKNAARKARNSK